MMPLGIPAWKAGSLALNRPDRAGFLLAVAPKASDGCAVSDLG